MAKTFSFLRRPYGQHQSTQLRLVAAFGFGAFVFFFLWFFGPFGIERLESAVRLRLSLGFGGVTTASMLLLNVLLPILLPGYFNETRWTAGREIFWTTLNLAFIGIMNAWFFSDWQDSPLSWSFILWFQGATWGLGILPVGFFVLLNERKYRLKYQKELAQWPADWSQSPQPVKASELRFPSDNKQEELSLRPEQFLFAQAADNYLSVYYWQEGQVQNTLLRSSLKQLEQHFAERSRLFRCHKSYLVNLDQVAQLSGNAQGYRLHLKNYPDQSIPVSRKLNQSIKERLTAQP